MPYVTYDYYTGTYMGVLAGESDFTILEARASEIIDDLTMYRVGQTSLADHPEFVQEQFKKSVCAQIDCIESNGGVQSIHEINAQSMKLGKFYYSMGSDHEGLMVSPLAYKYLSPTGLLYGGI